MDNGAKKFWMKPSEETRKKNFLVHRQRFNYQILSETLNTISTELASEAFALAKVNSYDAMKHLVKHASKRCLSNLKGYFKIQIMTKLF